MHAAFLRSICETPFDDAPRLIYADWLEEQGQREPLECSLCGGSGERRIDCVEAGRPIGCFKCGSTGKITDNCTERAEFIRVQCELAPLTSPHGTDEAINLKEGELSHPGPLGIFHCGCRWCELKRREKGLFLDRHSGGLSFLDVGLDVGQPSYTLEGVKYTYERGFVSSLEAGVAVFRLLANQSLFTKFPITKVVLTDREPQPWYPEADFHDSGPREGYYWDGWWDEDGVEPIHTLARQVNRYNKHMLPRPIFKQLLGGKSVDPYESSTGLGGIQRRIYPTLEEASLRLSQACVNYGRQLVELAPLYKETT